MLAVVLESLFHLVISSEITVALGQDEELVVRYPLYVTGKPEEEYNGRLQVVSNIYPEVKPMVKVIETGPITVFHERRKLKIGKTVNATPSVDNNEYEVILRGKNDGTAVITNVEITDFLPRGFELVGKPIEEPVVGFEEHSSINSGRAMKWIFEYVEPGQKVEIRYKIRALEDHDPIDVFRTLVG